MPKAIAPVSQEDPQAPRQLPEAVLAEGVEAWLG